MGATNFQLLREFVAHKQMAWCCWLEDKQPPVCFLQCSTAVTDFHFLLLAYGEPELQSFINTLGLLANKRRRVQRACWPITSSVAVWSRGRMRQPVRRRLNSLASDFSDRFSGRICCTFTMMASPVIEFARRFVFILARFRRAGPEEDLLCCWRKQRRCAVDGMIMVQVGSDTFSRRCSQKDPGVLLALNNIHFAPLFMCGDTRGLFRRSIKNDELDNPRVRLGPSFPLFCDKVVSLPSFSVPRIPLLLYEPLDLGPQRLQIFL